MYLPQELVLRKKVIFAEHKRSLHGGVTIIMSHVRSLFWIPHLRRLSKPISKTTMDVKNSEVYYSIRKNIFAFLFSIHNTISLSCHEQVFLYGVRFEGHFSHHRVYYSILWNQEHCLKIKSSLFEVIGTDSAGPIYYKTKSLLKAYILLFSCSVTRAVHIELASNLTTPEFIKSFRRLILRRGKHKIVYSNNAKTFKAGTKWLANITRD